MNVWKWGFWVRVGGWWFMANYSPNYKPLFSERYGYTKYKTVGPFVFKLRKDKLDI